MTKILSTRRESPSNSNSCFDAHIAYSTITVEESGGKFSVWLCDEGEDRCATFELYHDARAWAAGRYAQGHVITIDDKVAKVADHAQRAIAERLGLPQTAQKRPRFVAGVSFEQIENFGTHGAPTTACPNGKSGASSYLASG